LAPNTVGKKYFKVIITLSLPNESINPHKSLKPGDPAKKNSENLYFLLGQSLKKEHGLRFRYVALSSRKSSKNDGGFFLGEVAISLCKYM
jgi:hypothetical protein